MLTQSKKKKGQKPKTKKKKENLSEQVPTCPDWLRTNQKKRPIKKCWPNKRNKKAKNPKIKKKERKISAEQVPTCPDLPGLAPTGRQEEHVWTRPPSKHPPPAPPPPNPRSWSDLSGTFSGRHLWNTWAVDGENKKKKKNVGGKRRLMRIVWDTARHYCGHVRGPLIGTLIDPLRTVNYISGSMSYSGAAVVVAVAAAAAAAGGVQVTKTGQNCTT